ncbi:MAG: hypothetical protein ACRED9_00795 [Caulobacteraceae bacterium]
MARPPAKRLDPMFLVSLERTDGGDPLEDEEASAIRLMGEALVIVGTSGVLFSGEAWAWVEIRRIREERRLAARFSRDNPSTKAKERRRPARLRTHRSEPA